MPTTPTTRHYVDVHAAIKQAFDAIWAEKEKLRNNPSMYRSSEGFYVSRQEIIRRVRCYAYDDLHDQPRGTATYDHGVRLNFNLDHAVCDWLSDQTFKGRLERHNFGRSTITGARYRPHGSPISETEKRTMAMKEKARGKPRTVHFSERGKRLCQAKPLVPWSRSRVWTTTDKNKVTCGRCLKRMA